MTRLVKFAFIIAAALCYHAAAFANSAMTVGDTGFEPTSKWIVDIEIGGLPENFTAPKNIFPRIPALYNTNVIGRVILPNSARALHQLLSRHGYPYSKISADMIYDEHDSSLISLRFTVDANEQVCHAQPVIAVRAASINHHANDPHANNSHANNRAGNRTNRLSAMIAKDVADIANTLYNSDDIDEIVRRLFTRRYVNDVSAASPVIIENLPPCVVGGDVGLIVDDNVVANNFVDDDDNIKNTTLRSASTPIIVTENRGMNIDGAIGYRSASSSSSSSSQSSSNNNNSNSNNNNRSRGSLTGRLELSFVNMLARGELLDIAYFGSHTLQRFDLSGAVPWVWGLPLELGGEAGLEIEENANGDGEGYGFFHAAFSGAFDVNARYRVGASARWSEVVPSGADPDGAPLDYREPYHFYGAEIFAARITKPQERGAVVWELEIKTGGGIARRERVYNRNTAELAAGLHHPIINDNYAVVLRARAMSLFTDEERLVAAEMYRVGGYGSLRGYSEDEFAFRSVGFAQLELHRYFDRFASLYIFVDGGVGMGDANSAEQFSLRGASRMFGYGVGIKFPSRLGTLSVEWARNYDDESSLGRIHVGVRTL